MPSSSAGLAPVGRHPRAPERDGRRVRWRRIWDREAASAYRFLLVPLLLLALVKLYPFVYNFVLSVTRDSFGGDLGFVGLDNYRNTLSQQATVNALRNSIYLTALVVPLGTLLALFVALAANERTRFRAWIRLGFVLPMVTSVVVGSMVWGLILLPRGGLLNTALQTQGLNWLATPNLAMPAVAVVILWGAIGLNMLVFLAALQDIDTEVIDAAIVDGASYAQRIRYVVIPWIRPVLLFVVATLTITVFRSFGVIFVLTQGGPVQRTNTLVWEVYLNAFSYLRFNEAAAISGIMVSTILLLTTVYLRAIRRTEAS